MRCPLSTMVLSTVCTFLGLCPSPHGPSYEHTTRELNSLAVGNWQYCINSNSKLSVDFENFLGCRTLFFFCRFGRFNFLALEHEFIQVWVKNVDLTLLTKSDSMHFIWWCSMYLSRMCQIWTCEPLRSVMTETWEETRRLGLPPRCFLQIAL